MEQINQATGSLKSNTLITTKTKEMKKLIPLPERKCVIVDTEHPLKKFFTIEDGNYNGHIVAASHPVEDTPMLSNTYEELLQMQEDARIEKLAILISEGSKFLSDFPHHTPSVHYGVVKALKDYSINNYTEGDIRMAMLVMYYECAKKRISDIFYDRIVNDFIKSLQPTIQECEVEVSEQNGTILITKMIM